MLHDNSLINSAISYTKKHRKEAISDHDFYNRWAATNDKIHDFDTAMFFLNLISVYRRGQENDE